MRFRNGGREHYCGGIILDKRTILTAYHCLRKRVGYLRKGHVYVLAGATNNQNSGQFIQAESVILNHENPFVPGNNANDVALIKLTKDLVFNNYVKPACLPEKTANFTGKTCYASGWGHQYTGQKRAPDQLQFLPMPILSHAQCKR